MTTDRPLQLAVIDALAADTALVGTEIGVAVRDGVITLSGQVRRYAEKYAAERAAARVPGVAAVADSMTVIDPAIQIATDTYIAHLIVDALRWHTEVPSDRIRVKVANGWVTLEGDVEWHYQRRAAERTVRAAAPSFGVSNVIRIRPRAVALAAVAARVAGAGGGLVAESIQIEVDDGRITLRGTVRSEEQRLAARRAAWSTPGVTNVADLMGVAS